MLDRKNIIAELARGAVIRSVRVMPFPHTFTLDLIDGATECVMEEHAVQRLVDAKLIAGKPTDALWDHVEYRVTDQRAIEGEALEYWKHGFGHCETCDVVLGLGRSETASLAPRHGHTAAVKFKRADGSEGITTPAGPPCAGSGRPMTHVVRPLSRVASNAA